jgi:hypothetical protein
MAHDNTKINSGIIKLGIFIQKQKMKWSEVKFLGTKVPYILGWLYTAGTWLYCT